MKIIRSMLEGAFEAQFPDSFDWQSKLLETPSLDFVISRTREGTILSRYGDKAWNLSPYKSTRRLHAKIYFNLAQGSSREGDLNNEIRRILFILLYLPSKRGSKKLGVSSLLVYANFLRILASYAATSGVSIAQILGEESILSGFMKSRPSADSVKLLLALIRRLRQVGREALGYSVVDIKMENSLRLIEFELSQFRKQTPIIPSRIFIGIITSLLGMLQKYLQVSDKMIIFGYEIRSNYNIGRSKALQRSNGLKVKEYEDDFSELMTRIGLDGYCKAHQITDIIDLLCLLRQIQTACKVLIIAYSGMRSSEADSLNCDCLESEETLHGVVYRLRGETSKLSGSPKPVRWVCCADASEVIKAARSIASVIAGHSYIASTEAPLFPLVGSLIRKPPSILNNGVTSADIRPDKDFLVKHIVGIRITETDLQELRKIEPFRDWDNESKFNDGEVWPLTFHQFRRSLAVYAAQSGLVSLPSLKRQLKHITREMSLYYAKGAPDAVNLFGEDADHIRHQVERVRPEADALTYIYDVLLSDERLSGGHGQWVERYSKPSSQNILELRSATIKRFKDGEIAYRETPLGACTTTKPCTKRAMRAISACVSCERSVIKPSKLFKVIESQKKMLAQLDPETMVYRMELEQLSDLERMANSLKEG